jgi:L-asparagine oxygenase
MSLILDTESPPGVVTVVPSDAAAIEAVASDLLTIGGGRVDDPTWVASAREAWEDLPAGVRRPVRAFRRASGIPGALVLRGLPVGANIPPTPMVDGSVQRSATVAAAVLLMIASGIGDPAAFRAEKSGALVQDVVPVPGKERFQGNAGSVLLSFHIENAFHEHRPDFVLLVCLRADHQRVAGLRTACVRQALPLLSPSGRAALSSAEFTTAAPPSFGGNAGSADRHAVLFGAPDDPNLRVDFAATVADNRRGEVALTELREIFGEVALTHRLRAGELAIVDNRVTVHGRTEFRPRYDGRDRWLQRTFSLADLRRSRGSRADDGHVLVG